MLRYYRRESYDSETHNVTSESASARVRCRGRTTAGMNLLLYNDLQKNQDIRHRAQTQKRLVNALDVTPCKAHGFELLTSDRGNHSSHYTTARTGKGNRHCHRDCPRDSFTYPETWKESGPRHMKIAAGVGTRSRTRLAEIEKREVAQAQAAHARWPPSPDTTETIQELTRELTLCDVSRNAHKELQHVLPSGEEDMIRTPRQPPVAGLMTRHQDTYYIPPPRAVGGARGNSAPVSTATLGLIQRQDPSLAAQLREDPASMMTQATRHKVYSTMRLIRAGMLGH